MYSDQAIIKEKLEDDLLNKFGENVKNDVFSLVDKLSGKDTFVDSHLLLSLQNLLSLPMNEAHYFTNLALDLASASAFAPVLLLEKIPTLSFYGVTDQIGKFLSNIKDYGARAIALFLGSDQLKTDDLIDILEHSTITYYTLLLQTVNNRHAEFGVCCAMIMRSAAKIEAVVPVHQLNEYLDICLSIMKKYGTKIAEQYISHSDQWMAYIPLGKSLQVIDSWFAQSIVSAEFAVTYPNIVFKFKGDASPGSYDHLSAAEIKLVKIDLLKNENYAQALGSASLLEDKHFSALLLNWPHLSAPLKNNILFQLQSENYKQYILSNAAIKNELNSINAATGSNWMKPWVFFEEVMDLTFIRASVGRLLRKNIFSVESKSIIKAHSDLFDRSNTQYDHHRVKSMINVLLSYCLDPLAKHELIAMSHFMAGDSDAWIHLLSQSSLVIQAWGRDPWVDYGQSDEFYSCTSLGDYNAGNAPAFLADLNLNNLDIWSNGIKVGRIHLCLVNDNAGKPMLLLDCIDGTERMITSQQKYALIMKAVLAYARFIGVHAVKVNYDVDYNTTPKKFIRYVEAEYQDQKRVDFVSRFLTVSTTRQLIPYPCQTFLESFIKNNAGFIRGTLISL